MNRSIGLVVLLATTAAGAGAQPLGGAGSAGGTTPVEKATVLYHSNPNNGLAGHAIDAYLPDAATVIAEPDPGKFVTAIASAQDADLVLVNTLYDFAHPNTVTAAMDAVIAAKLLADALAVEWGAPAYSVDKAIREWQARGYKVAADVNELDDKGNPLVAGTLFQIWESPGTAICCFVDAANPNTSARAVRLTAPGNIPAAIGGLKDWLCAIRATAVCSGWLPGIFLATGSCPYVKPCCCDCLPKVWNFSGSNHCHKCDSCITPLCNTIWCWLFGLCNGC